MRAVPWITSADHVLSQSRKRDSPALCQQTRLGYMTKKKKLSMNKDEDLHLS